MYTHARGMGALSDTAALADRGMSVLQRSFAALVTSPTHRGLTSKQGQG